jgi:hypothetical protein
MSHFRTALAIGLAVIAALAASAGSAQAANKHPHSSLFELIDGLGKPFVLVEADVRISAVDLTGDGPPNKPSKKGDGNGEWEFEVSDGTWHFSSEERTDSLTSNTLAKPETIWTTQQVSQPTPKWTPHPASP